MEQQTIPVNPLLQKIRIPGQTFTLPSQGIFYKNGELDESVENGEVYILPMSALDEIVFKSPDRLFSGKAIEEVFSRRIPQIKKPGKLLAKDVDFLLTCLAMLSFGDRMEVNYKHTCEDAKTHQYDIAYDTFIKQTKRIDPTNMNAYNVRLDNGQVVHLRPPLYENILELFRTPEVNMNKTDEEREAEETELAFKTVRNMIIDVDGIGDKLMILEWLKELPVMLTRQIRDALVNTSDWGPTYKATIVCKDCGEEITVEVTTNPISFFT